MEKLKFGIWRTTHKPGCAHFFMGEYETKRESIFTGEVDRETVSEIRPDWGQYSPVPTLSALERYIRKSGLAPECTNDQRWSYGFIGLNKAEG